MYEYVAWLKKKKKKVFIGVCAGDDEINWIIWRWKIRHAEHLKLRYLLQTLTCCLTLELCKQWTPKVFGGAVLRYDDLVDSQKLPAH